MPVGWARCHKALDALLPHLPAWQSVVAPSYVLSRCHFHEYTLCCSGQAVNLPSGVAEFAQYGYLTVWYWLDDVFRQSLLPCVFAPDVPGATQIYFCWRMS